MKALLKTFGYGWMLVAAIVLFFPAASNFDQAAYLLGYERDIHFAGGYWLGVSFNWFIYSLPGFVMVSVAGLFKGEQK